MKSLTFSVLVVVAFFTFTEPCYANPISFNPAYEISWTAFWIFLITAPFIEAWLIVSISRSRVKPWQTLKRLFWVLVLINVITFIATQVLAYYITIWDRSGANFIGYFAEILPLVTEYLLLRWLFTRLHRIGMFPNPISNTLVIGMTLLANLVTLLAGFAFLFGLNHSLGMGVTPWPW